MYMPPNSKDQKQVFSLNPSICDHSIQIISLQVVTALYQLGLCRQHDKKNGSTVASESGSETRWDFIKLDDFKKKTHFCFGTC